MTVEIRATRKVVVIGWDTEQVKGASASIQARSARRPEGVVAISAP